MIKLLNLIYIQIKIKTYTGLNFIELQSGMQVPVNIMRWRHLKSEEQVEFIHECFLQQIHQIQRSVRKHWHILTPTEK